MAEKKTLLILAAGMGSRYGGNKQIDAFGPNNEMIMDYSIYDAIRAGFNKIVFVIREDFYEDFRKAIESRWLEKVEICFVFQSIDLFCKDKIYLENRQKPWGTAHAILCAKDSIQEPFLMINADDFYGSDSFVKAIDILTLECKETQYGMVAYQLKQTVSKHGSVSRGVCEVKNDLLIKMVEHTKIFFEGDKIVSEGNTQTLELNPNKRVSMNFFCFHHSIFKNLENDFQKFLPMNYKNLKSEFLISSFVDDCINKLGIKLKVVDTAEKWFGVTYIEDANIVREEIKTLIANNHYPIKL